MKHYTAWEYLLMDAATHQGLGKKTFEERIQWGRDNLASLEQHQDTAEDIPLYRAAVLAIREVEAGRPIGTLVSMDAVCSGLQLMAVLSGDVNAGRMTGLVDTNRRPDAYTDVTNHMNTLLGSQAVTISRTEAKDAVMTAFYGSKAVPKHLFGEDSPALRAFYKTLETQAPGPWQLVNLLLKAWNPKQDFHEWAMPDDFQVRIPSLVKNSGRVEVEELDGISFTYEWEEQAAYKKGLHLPANVIHSVDAYVARCMHRRLNYNPQKLQEAWDYLSTLLLGRECGEPSPNELPEAFPGTWNWSGLVDLNMLNLPKDQWSAFPTPMIRQLIAIIRRSLAYRDFHLVTIHDDYRCHPNHMNRVREEYRHILVEISRSTLMKDLLEQLGMPGYRKISQGLTRHLEKSAYALT